MKEVMNRDLGLITDSGFVISSNDACISNNDLECVLSFTADNTDTFTYNGFTYKPIVTMGKVDYIIFVKGDDTLARNYSDILQVSFSSVKSLYDDKHDKLNFIKNFLLDNILPGDILAKAADLHIPIDTKRVVFLIQTEKISDFSVLELIEGMFPNKQSDFVVSIDENNVALVKELDGESELSDLQTIAKGICDNISTEVMVKAVIGIGTVINNVKEIARSYKEARVALEVGKVFDDEKSILSYEDLGIGRLIYQLPTTLCELFLTEVFKKGSIDDLDQEIIFTIQKFFENNLNVSETSRQLYVHRNTLVYRLDKIQKITGLDLRVFDQAIIFKVAMMVNKYLRSNTMKL
jgi:carbohydrate diacid regulator